MQNYKYEKNKKREPALFRSLEAQIASALPRSREMLHRRTKSSLISLSTVFEDIIDST